MSAVTPSGVAVTLTSDQAAVLRAADACIDDPRRTLLVVHGGTGTGKSLLCEAIVSRHGWSRVWPAWPAASPPGPKVCGPSPRSGTGCRDGGSAATRWTGGW
jgi:hypothetical protein